MTYRHSRLAGFATCTFRCTAVGVVCLLLLVLPRTAVPASAPWQTLPQTPPLPSAVKSGYASVNGIRTFYAVFGHGSPVLLLHGALANSNYWGDVIPILVRNHFKVIVARARPQHAQRGAIQLRAHGL
jgi:hypothetical protein